MHDELDYDVQETIISPHQFGIPQHRKRIYIVGVRKDLGGLKNFKFPKPTNAQCDIHDIIDEEDTKYIPLKENTRRHIEIWSEFVRLAAENNCVLPSFPIWAMEFGATYDYEGVPPCHQSKKQLKGKYDVQIAFLEGPITRIFSYKNKNVKKIAWIHNDISQVFGKGIKSKLKRILDNKIYSKYDKLIFVSKDNMLKFDEIYSDINVDKQVIYNYIDKEKVLRKAENGQDIKFDENVINFVTVTRLVEQKAIDRLIKVHKKLIDNGYYHKIYVIGDGPEREKLENLVKANDIDETFLLLGKKENPYPYIKNATYFCLLSKFEGYGMVIEEAKILNKPIIITDTAAREALVNYKNSKILNNTEEGIYDGLKKAIENKPQESETEAYDNENIIEELKSIL